MQSVSNISSEEELLQLRDEGKISEAEYQDLLAAMRTPPPQSNEDTAPGTDKAKFKYKVGRIAFVFMLVGIALPIAVFLLDFAITGRYKVDAIFSRTVFVVMQLFAFVLGVTSWPDVYGKATVVVVAIMASVMAIFMFPIPYLALVAVVAVMAVLARKFFF
ncbi:MAG: hypothetical protein ISS79_12600 [Phycisphaerae bacterium]|nr:hypothetical protein [Phycisphaerae bacterium]